MPCDNYALRKRDAKPYTRYVKGVPFVNRKETKGLPLLSKVVYRKVRGWTSRQRACLYKAAMSYLPHPPGAAKILQKAA